MKVKHTKLRNLVQLLAVGACMLLGVGETIAAGIITTQTAVEPGAWTSDFNGAKAYAERNNVPMFVFWANKGCSHCEAVEREMKKSPFTEWMAERKILMVFSESNSTVKKWIKENAVGKISDFPYAAVYWPKNSANQQVLVGFSAYKGKMSAFGASSKDSNVQQVMDTVDFLIPDWDPTGGTVIPDPDPVYYTVNFVVDASKGTASGSLSQRVESGKGAAAPTVVAKEGWEFSGWDKSFSKVTSDLTVTAKFAAKDPVNPDPVYYTVNFVVDASKGTATGSLSQQVESGKGAVAPTVVANEGWEFSGWDKSFSKVTGNLTVTAKFDAVVDRDEIDPVKFFKKSKKVNAIAYKDDSLFGRAVITIGKYTAKKKLKVTVKITSFGGKSYSKTVSKVEPDKYGDILDLDVAFKSPIGTMTFNLVNNDGEYEVVGEGDGYSVETGGEEIVIGGPLTPEDNEMMFTVEFDDEIEPENENYEFIVDAPVGVSATVGGKGTSLNFGSAPKLKYNRYREDGESWYELAEYDEDRYPNVNAVKITYKSATGAFTGSFNIYASNEFAVEGKKPTLKTYKAKVSGYVVNGVGIGTVSVKIGRKTYAGICSLE